MKTLRAAALMVWMVLLAPPQLLFQQQQQLFVASFGWQKVNTLSERLMGSRPEWVWGKNDDGRRVQQQQQAFFRRRDGESSSNTRLGSSTSASSTAQSSTSSSTRSSTKQDQAQMLEFINEPTNTLLGMHDLNPTTPLDGDTMDLLHCIVRAADGRKAQDITALKVHHVTTLTSILVIVSGNSRPQNQAIAAAISKDVQQQFFHDNDNNAKKKSVPEGSAESGWMLLDYGAVMVHIMTPKSRLFYNVQGQWMQKGAIEMDLSHLLVPNHNNNDNNNDNPPLQQPPHFSAAATATSQSRQQQQQQLPQQPEDDPFWS